MSIRIKSSKNLLDLTPVKSENKKFEAITNEENLVTIIIHRNGIFDNFIRKFIKKTPLTFNVELDEFGSFVYTIIDGEKDIHALGILVKEKFGEDCEPLYERLGGFINLLKNNDFIYFK